MKKLHATLMICLMFIASSVFLISCAEDENIPEVEEISQETKAKFKELGFDVSDITMTKGDGFQEPGNYLLEGDITISPETLEEMLNSDIHHIGPMGEQYRTNNLVTGTPRTISVIGYTGGVYALNSTMRTALQWAINNYNAISLDLSFSLSYATSTSADIVVYKYGSGAGGVAGFPSGGNPYKWVAIYGGTSSYGTNVTEHVITHEIGHCVGLRHTDYFNRSLSCGSGGNEGSAGVGAVHVPGTPTGFDSGSVMLACFSSSEDGEFGTYDVTALQYLY